TRHVAPSPVMVLAGIQKKPLTRLRRAGSNVAQLIRSQQLSSYSGDGPQHPVEVENFIIAPLEAPLPWNQSPVSSRALHIGVELGQRRGRRRTLLHDRPKDIVDSLPQIPCPQQNLLCALWLGI